MRIRYLKPGFHSNETLALLEPIPWPKLTFAGLWSIADREGRLKDSPRWIHGLIFPYNEVDIERCLATLASAGFIARYEAGGERFIAVPRWSAHQRPHIKEVASTIPSPNRRKPSVKTQSPSLGSAEHDLTPEKAVLSPLGMGNGELGTGTGNRRLRRSRPSGKFTKADPSRSGAVTIGGVSRTPQPRVGVVFASRPSS